MRTPQRQESLDNLRPRAEETILRDLDMSDMLRARILASAFAVEHSQPISRAIPVRWIRVTLVAAVVFLLSALIVLTATLHGGFNHNQSQSAISSLAVDSVSVTAATWLTREVMKRSAAPAASPRCAIS